MIPGYEEYGFSVTAKYKPESCTACPFWELDLRSLEHGVCFLSGTWIVADGSQDDCPLDKKRDT